MMHLGQRLLRCGAQYANQRRRAIESLPKKTREVIECDGVTLYRCTHCKAMLPRDSFRPLCNPRSKCKILSWCKGCEKELAKDYYKRHAEAERHRATRNRNWKRRMKSMWKVLPKAGAA